MFCSKCGAMLNTETGLCPNCEGYRTSNYNSTAAYYNAPKRNAKAHKNRSVKNTVITILLAMCLFITSFLSIAVYSLRNTAKPDNLYELAECLLTEQMLMGTEKILGDDYKNFTAYLKNSLNIELDYDKLEKLMNKAFIKEYFAEKAADFCDDFFDGEAELVITKYELTRLFQENSGSVYNIFGIYMSNETIELIFDWIIPQNQIVIADSSTVKDSAPLLYYGIKIGMSYATMVVMIILSALIVFLMIFNCLPQGLCAVGIDFSVIGGLCGIVGALSLRHPEAWSAFCGNSIIGVSIGGVMAVNVWLYFILLAVGIVSLVVGSLVKKPKLKM